MPHRIYARAGRPRVCLHVSAVFNTGTKLSPPAQFYAPGPSTDITWGVGPIAQGYGRVLPTSWPRHTFATRLAEKGVSESTMLALMGHMSRAMLERYSHIRMAAKREAVAGVTLRQMGENSEV